LSVAGLLERSARDMPDRRALLADGRTWSYADLWHGSQVAAGALRRAGVGPGRTVLIAVPNRAGFFQAFFGTLICGGIAVPVFARSAPERLVGLARLAEASALVIPTDLADADLAALIALAARDGRTLLTLADLEEAGPPVPAAAAADDPERPCYIQFTSGSTADPRGVVISHRALLANIAQMVEAMGITPDEVFVSWLPTYHDMGLTLMALTPFSLGARLVLLPTDLRDVAGWLRAIQDHRGTFTAGPDFAYRLCVRNVRHPERFDLSSLQVCMNASEPVRAATLAGFEAAFGLRQVMMTGYGLAEATLSVTCTSRGEPIGADDRGLVCLGRAMPGSDVRIAKPAGSPPQQPGEIVVAGPATCSGYYRNPAASAALAAADGYLRTGDLGYLDVSGRLYFVARRKELIKVGGRSLYPQEVEALVDEITGIRLSAAVGIDRGGMEGEQLYVFGEARQADTTGSADGVGAADLRSLAMTITREVRRALGLRPRAVVLLRPRRIPLTSNGKLRRAALRDAFLDGSLAPGVDIIYPPSARPATTR
jgi:acyl-CoA synthetase (AMP-forming)/AMP-acid ligase II